MISRKPSRAAYEARILLSGFSKKDESLNNS